MAKPPEGYAILTVAERFGQLPETIENTMTEYWFNRAVVMLEAENIAAKAAMGTMGNKSVASSAGSHPLAAADPFADESTIVS